jgi:hypothetical protein
MKARFLRRKSYGMDISGEVNDASGNIRDTSISPEFNHTDGNSRNFAQDPEAEKEFPGLGPSKYTLQERRK